MKSILKTFNAGFISNFALIGIVSILVSACGSVRIQMIETLRQHWSRNY